MATTYTVRTGDTLFEIAVRFGTTVEALARANNITNPDVIRVGQVLTIPEAGEAGEPGGTGETGGGANQTRQVRGLLYRISTDRTSFRQGEPVRITFSKTNVTNRNITLRYRTAQRFELVARRVQGLREVWRWSAGQFFAQVTGTVTLRPGQSQVFRVTWDQRNNRGVQVTPGNFVIEGTNLAEGLAGESVATTISIRAFGPTPTPTPTPIPTPTPCPPGNILANPGFERWPNPSAPPTDWTGSNLARSRLSETGAFAAELGDSPGAGAVLAQRVNIEPGRIYELIWRARERVRPGVARFILFVEIFYYDRAGNFVGRTEPRYSQENIPDNRYQRYSLSTGRVPAGARVADVRFTFEPAVSNTNSVLVDNVELRCRF